MLVWAPQRGVFTVLGLLRHNRVYSLPWPVTREIEARGVRFTNSCQVNPVMNQLEDRDSICKRSQECAEAEHTAKNYYLSAGVENNEGRPHHQNIRDRNDERLVEVDAAHPVPPSPDAPVPFFIDVVQRLVGQMHAPQDPRNMVEEQREQGHGDDA